MKDVVEAQNKRRKGEPYPMAKTMEEIDYLIARVRSLEHDLSTVHTDQVTEHTKLQRQGRKVNNKPVEKE
jgi:hypothetical protein